MCGWTNEENDVGWGGFCNVCVFGVEVLSSTPLVSQPHSHQRSLTPPYTRTHTDDASGLICVPLPLPAPQWVAFPPRPPPPLPPVRIPSSCCALGEQARPSSAPCSGACTPRQERPRISPTSSFVAWPWPRFPPRRASSSQRRMTGSKHHRRGRLERTPRRPLPSFPCMGVGLMCV